MPITEAQRIERRNHIGSSDVPCILGLIEGRGPGDIYASKVFELDDKTNKAMERGNRLEPVLIEYAKDEIKPTTCEVSPETMIHPGGILAVNLDAMFHGPNGIVEAKSPGYGLEYGEAGTDEVPLAVIAQTHAQFACVPEIEIAWVPVLIPVYGRVQFRLFEVRRSEKLVDHIVKVVENFYHMHIEARVPPEDSPPSLETIRRISRREGTSVDLETAMVREWRDAAEARKAAEKRDDAAKATVLMAMGDAVIGHSDLGDVVCSQVSKKEYTVKATQYWMTRFKGKK